MSVPVLNRPFSQSYIVTVTLLVECQQDSGTVYIFPFIIEDMAVTGLRHH